MRPKPLIGSIFSSLKPIALVVKCIPFPTMICVKIMNMIVGAAKKAVPHNIKFNPLKARETRNISNSSGVEMMKNPDQLWRIHLLAKPKMPSANRPAALEENTNISFDDNTLPSSRAFSRRRWVGSSVFSWD